MTLDEICGEVERLREKGYFPDSVAFSVKGCRNFARRLYEEEGELLPPMGGTVFGLKIKIVYDLPEEYRVYQTATKLDPEWPNGFLRRLAVNSLVKP